MRLVLQQTEEINYGASHKGRPVKNRKHAECRSISNRNIQKFRKKSHNNQCLRVPTDCKTPELTLYGSIFREMKTKENPRIIKSTVKGKFEYAG